MRNTYLFGFATFGHPNDYRQSPFKFDDESIAKSVRIFDLSNAIKIFPSTTLYSVRKENINGVPGVSYSIYTYAKEMTSTREGTFIGSTILYTNEIGEENITIGQLNEFHSILVRENTSNAILKVNHSKDFSHSKDFLSDFEKIGFHLNPFIDLTNYSLTNKNIVVFSRIDPNTLTTHFKKSLLLLNKFDNVFFSDSRDIIEYCRNRNIYLVTDENGFEKEIENTKYENQQRVKNYTSDIEKEIHRLEDDKQKTLNDFRLQIEQNEKRHQENESKIKESKNDLVKVTQLYNDFSSKIRDLANQLKSGRKLEDAKLIHNENKRLFINGISQLKKPDFINKIPKANAKSSLQIEQKYQEYKSSHPIVDGSKEEKVKYRVDTFKVATFVLFLLLIGTWIYFLLFGTKTEREIIQVSEQEISAQTEPEVKPQIHVEALNPTPNSELSEKDYRIIAKKIEYGTKVGDVLKIIFEKNPTDIANSYKGQEVIYAKQIIELNKTCFEEKEGIFLFAKDTLRHIPSYKKEK